VADGLIDRMLPGDVMQVVESGGVFVVEDPTVEQDRFDRHEIVATGAMFGPKMKFPSGEAAAREARVLERHQITLEAFSRFPKLTSGTRRRSSSTEDLNIAAEGGLRFRFTLPSGVYATTLLREFMKNDVPPAAG
jgi:tRNA pseudouridine13 synthase